jgi:hypothetical protein
MNRTRFLVLLLVSIAAVPILGGCIAYVHTSLPIVIGTEDYHGYHGYYGRPHSQYYCYDCHGYTYFDPYYDYCVHYGFRFSWSSYPSLRRYHREHYPLIVKNTPHFGEYKYKADYRRNPKYERPPDYQTWKKSEGRTFYTGKESYGQKSPGSTGKESQQLKSRGESKGKSSGESQKKSKGESRDKSQGKSDRGK